MQTNLQTRQQPGPIPFPRRGATDSTLARLDNAHHAVLAEEARREREAREIRELPGQLARQRAAIDAARHDGERRGYVDGWHQGARDIALAAAIGGMILGFFVVQVLR